MSQSPITDATIDALSQELYDAWRTRVTIAPLRTRTGLDLPGAYRVAEGFVRRRVEAGETIVGKKIGVTSRPMQNMLGVDQPDFGQLTSGMWRPDGGTMNVAGMIAPKSEAEMAFVLAKDLVGPGITAVDVLRATAYVSPCLEIVDSRITNWDIGIIDTVADNASCGEFVIGEAKADPFDVDLNLAGMVVEVDGEVITTGCGAAVQWGPANAVAWLANTLGALGLPFRAGEVILSGSQSVLVPAVAGTTVKCTIGGLGSCSINFVSEPVS
jgi:2-oxopent-4-enoate/cis-2-oxohex-4-enoate hydratase